ncbi:hypothetical protein Rsub_09669 [Raphidocelis subcapitata]|uniref:Uncharacterized protein n=1 Tax=Raphidocelis subcapitata TaxID=307507 RepID=A0A2V0PFY8_9CHLO|nr:hypothetical protein Rsub_09669 [Raphidocelis subcapitata]|eukprot:GBF96813.1 hypothetical protein Rsub_09669 [Raphidocelis subcapitata]
MATSKGGTGSVKVLHRSASSSRVADAAAAAAKHAGAAGAVGAPDVEQQLAALRQENAALRDRMAHAEQDRERLQDEVRLHKQGCSRAEDLLRRGTKDAEAAAAAKARLEETNRRLLEELRLTRVAYLEAEGTIRQLLVEITQVKGRAAAAPGSSAPASGAGAPAAGAAPAAAGAATSNGGRPRRGDLVRQLAALQAVAQSASAAHTAVQAQLEEVAAEKERAEGNERLVTQTAASLLEERSRLLNALAAEKDAVREMEVGIMGLANQLSLVLDDRDVLLEHLAARMEPCDLESLVARMAIVSDPASDAGSGSGGGSARGSRRGSDAGGGAEGGGEGAH